MFKNITKLLSACIAICLCFQLVATVEAQSVPEEPARVKELNFVFLHGAGSNPCKLQLLADSILEEIPAYILSYQKENPDIGIEVDVLNRCYPNDVDIRSWANNIANTVNKYLADKENLILVGHSVGGKAALYAVSHNIGNLADKVVMVVTINSPIKELDSYYVVGGGSVVDYCNNWFSPLGQGGCNSVAYYDSSRDGSKVANSKHWLAFISGELAPLSEQFDFGGLDGWPRDIDDGAIPISAQYADVADVIYYGNYGHSDFADSEELSEYMANQILHYIFGGYLGYSVLARNGSYEHRAGWLPGTDFWQDVVGDVVASSGVIEHKNESYFWWQEWEDVVGDCIPGEKRSSYSVSRAGSIPFFTSIKEWGWFNTDDKEDCRLRIRTRAAPRTSIKVNWSTYVQGLLPEGFERDRYEINIVTGTPLTSIAYTSWLTDDPRDVNIKVWSKAERPFRWFQVEWRVYFIEPKERKVINEIPSKLLETVG
jgi:pimeloyl-ACP methyl ester carboxylesterase